MPKLTIADSFQLFTKNEKNLGSSLIISAHGRMVDTHKDTHCGVRATAPHGSRVWLLAPPDSSMQHEPYDQIMQKAAPLILDMQGNYALARKYTGSDVPNIMLSKFKEKPGENEGTKIKAAIDGQSLPVWDILTVRKEIAGVLNLGRVRAAEVSLEAAFRAIATYCGDRQHRYNMIVGHFCMVREGTRDDRQIYEAGYRKMD